MKIYLASRYSRRAELLTYKAILEKIGHTVTSRWLLGDHQVSDTGLSDEAEQESRERFAREDLNDLANADCCISFTETPREMNSSRGGRHVEFGMAYISGKQNIIIGPRENVFHCLPNVIVCSNFAELTKMLLDQMPSFEIDHRMDSLRYAMPTESILSGSKKKRKKIAKEYAINEIFAHIPEMIDRHNEQLKETMDTFVGEPTEAGLEAVEEVSQEEDESVMISMTIHLPRNQAERLIGSGKEIKITL